MECIGCAGTDHVDLQAAIDHGITVAEVAYCKSISVAEHVVMSILGLVRNYIPSYEWVMKGVGAAFRPLSVYAGVVTAVPDTLPDGRESADPRPYGPGLFRSPATSVRPRRVRPLS
jgi:lactate dehydrogenase-like 2-hydroxyacid dehydrogenase